MPLAMHRRRARSSLIGTHCSERPLLVFAFFHMVLRCCPASSGAGVVIVSPSPSPSGREPRFSNRPAKRIFLGRGTWLSGKHTVWHSAAQILARLYTVRIRWRISFAACLRLHSNARRGRKGPLSFPTSSRNSYPVSQLHTSHAMVELAAIVDRSRHIKALGHAHRCGFRYREVHHGSCMALHTGLQQMVIKLPTQLGAIKPQPWSTLCARG